MEMIEFKGDTVSDALLAASVELTVPSDDLYYEVVSEGSTGFLGLGKKQAVIKARKKTDSDRIAEEIAAKAESEVKEITEEVKEEKPKFKMEVKQEQVNVDTYNNKTSVNKKAENKPKKQDKPANAAQTETKKSEFKIATKVESAKDNGANKDNAVKSSDNSYKKEVKENKVEETKPVKEERVIINPSNLDEVISKTKEYLDELFKAMQIETEVKIEFDAKYNDLNIEMAGEEMGFLIGKRGATLDSLQYLTSLYVNKISDQYLRVKMDTEGYRAKRKKTLESLARNMARKAAKTRKSVYLEPMNPYERRIIHSALQNDRYVTTRSEGEEPYRKVVIVLKGRR